MLVKPNTQLNLKRRDPDETFGWDKEAAKSELLVMHERIDVMQRRLAAEHQHSLLVVLQAMDACGKDGTIRAVFGGLNPAGVKVVSFKAPVGRELEHDYLWNRSHYESVLVERVKGLVTIDRCDRRYRHIREFERLLVDEGTRIVKINLNVSFEEQRVRLQDRIDDPVERWKFRLGDLDDRKLWPDYRKAYELALSQTSTESAPWFVVPGNKKWVRNLAVAKIVLAELESIAPKLPPDDPALAGLQVV